jgi:hypothetical protein
MMGKKEAKSPKLFFSVSFPRLFIIFIFFVTKFYAHDMKGQVGSYRIFVICGVHSKKITEPMLSNWILHQWHFHWGNTCLFLPPTTCFTVTVNEIKDTQFVLLI